MKKEDEEEKKKKNTMTIKKNGYCWIPIFLVHPVYLPDGTAILE